MSEASNEFGFPSEVLALADAMAVRQGQISEIGNQVFAGLTGVEYQPKTPEELRRSNLGRTVLYLAKIESPEAPLSWAELVEVSHEKAEYAKTAEELSLRTGSEIEAGAIRGFTDAILIEMRDGVGMTDEKITKDFAKTLETAREVAADHETDVATVYATDDLYYETWQRAFAPAETVDDLTRAVDTYSGEMLNKVFVQQLETMLPKEMLEFISKEEMDEMVLEMQLDPQVQAAMEVQSELFREVMRQTGTFLVTRIYGDAAIEELSAEQKQKLLPRQPLVAGLFDDK